MSYKLEVYNTHIEVNDYDFFDCEKLIDYFKFYEAFTFQYRFIHYDKDSRKLYLPRGLDVSFVESLLGVRAHFNSISDSDRIYKNSTPILLKYPPRDNKQKECIQFLTGKGKYAYTSRYTQLMVALGTGKGKTYLGIFYMALLNVKSIIITSNIDWLRQWKERILFHTNLNQKQIHLISGTKEMLSKSKKDPYDLADMYSIYLISHSTISNFINNYGKEELHKFFIKLGIGLKIYDEAHLNFENMANIDFFTNTFKTLYLSATPARGEENENRVYNLYFKNVPKISLFDRNVDPRTNYISVLYNSGISPIELNKCYTIHGFSKTRYADYIIRNGNFYKAVAIIFNIISRIPGKKMFFLSTNESIMQLQDWIRLNYPEYRDHIGIYTSINPTKTYALDFPIILTTSKSAGAAVDISGLGVSINLLEPTRSAPQNQQRLGRTRGNNTYYIDLVDCDCRSCRDYYIANLEMFRTHCISTRELDCRNDILGKRYNNVIVDRQKGINPFVKC